MQKSSNKKSGVSAGAVAAISASVLALAAGSYYFFGPEGKKNRGKLKGWMIKMKGEIVEKMEDAKDVSEEVYHRIVDGVAASVVKAGKATPEEVVAFAAMLKRQWKGFSKGGKKGSKKSGAKKAPAQKKSAKKAAPKKAAARSPQAKKKSAK